MNQRATLILGALMAGLGVAIGAFGAHGLKPVLLANARLDTFELAVKYQFYHAFALLTTGILMNFYSSRAFRWASVLFLLGIMIFSGSLYVLSLSGLSILGAITPIGGVAFIGGWVFFIAGLLRRD